MVGVVAPKEEAEIFLNQCHNLAGAFTSDALYNGYAVFPSMDKIKKMFELKHFLDLRMQHGVPEEQAEKDCIEYAKMEMEEVLTYGSAPQNRHGHEFTMGTVE
jgi:hypothetical protein